MMLDKILFFIIFLVLCVCDLFMWNFLCYYFGQNSLVEEIYIWMG